MLRTSATPRKGHSAAIYRRKHTAISPPTPSLGRSIIQAFTKHPISPRAQTSGISITLAIATWARIEGKPLHRRIRVRKKRQFSILTNSIRIGQNGTELHLRRRNKTLEHRLEDHDISRDRNTRVVRRRPSPRIIRLSGAGVPERHVPDILLGEIAAGSGVEGGPGWVHEGCLVERGGEVDDCAVVEFVGAVGLADDLGAGRHCCLDHVGGEVVEAFAVGLAIYAIWGDADCGLVVARLGRIGGGEGEG